MNKKGKHLKKPCTHGCTQSKTLLNKTQQRRGIEWHTQQTDPAFSGGADGITHYYF